MDKRLKVFLYVCFGISFIAGGAFHFLGGDLSSASGMFFASAYMLIPLISVIITQLIFGEKPFSDVGVSFKINKWWFVAWLLMPVVNILAMFSSALLPGVSLDPNSELVRLAIADMSTKGLEIDGWGLLAITIVGSLFAGFTINAFFAFGEEIAWRGFLPRVMSDWGFWKKSLIIGIIWGFWHMPLIFMGHNYPDHPIAGVFMMILLCVVMTPVFLYLREKSGSTMVAAIAHGTLNGSAGISVMYLAGGNDLLCGTTGLVGIIIFVILDLLIYLLRKNSITL
ncbi:MAG: CPBP family intramembrane metalloprotease [Paludibacteraceae bacterium]|nr:CPBP family intramembrane metalloprotease [Paludibacteraceae bacterium]